MTATRNAMHAVVRQVRAYFAPVARATGTPAVFDPAGGPFDFEDPPAPWVDLGWVANLKRSAVTQVKPLAAGEQGAAAAQFRNTLGARLELDFLQWGKLQMALAAGSEHMNVLEPAAGAPARASGASALAAVPLLGGSTAQSLLMDASGLSRFAAGDLVVVDVDYVAQTGYVGSGMAGAYVRDADEINDGADYIRRVSFNLARVEAVLAGSLSLAPPLLGGAPAAGAKAQKVIGFVDREGGSFFQEWSALLVFEQDAGGRACFHYPRLQAAAPAAESSEAMAEGRFAAALHASFVALPVQDGVDGQSAVCYRSFFPAAGAEAW